MSGRFDLAIVGAGPAGSSLALLTARAGARVLLVEKSRFDIQRAGETASPECRDLLTSLGLSCLCAQPFATEAAAVVSVWGEPVERARDGILSPFGPGVQLDRQRFDAALAATAAEAGATFVRGTTARLDRDPSGRHVLALSNGATAIAGYVAVCDGRHSTGAGKRLTRLYLNDHVCLAMRLDCPVQAPVMLVEAVPQGWIYAAGQPDGSTVLALTTRRSLAAGRRARDELWTAAMRASVLVPRYLGDVHTNTRLTVWNSRASAARKVAGHDWCLLGDSRFAMDPLSGRGLERAFADARIAAAHLATGDTATLADDLRARSAADLEAHTQATIATYGSEQRFAGQAFW